MVSLDAGDPGEATLVAANNDRDGDRTGAPRQLRISVVLSGGASLGAYEAGAFAALLAGVQRVQREDSRSVIVDGVGGASAGALVALFGAYALLEGLDPIDFLHEAWVERVSLDILRRRAGQGLLSFDRLRDDVRDFLCSEQGSVRLVAQPQEASIGLHVALTGLQGLTYSIRSVEGDERFTAQTYSDWGQFVLEPVRGAEQIFTPAGRSPLDYVLASAAHPGAFTPALLDRREHVDTYRSNGIENFPDSGHLWYSDGGLMQTEPLGRALETARRANKDLVDDREFARAVVLIDPRSEDPSGASRWTDPSNTPRWLDGLRRALEILPAQHLYDDAVRLEGSNRRLRWAAELVDTLAPHLDGEAEEKLRDFLKRVVAEGGDSPDPPHDEDRASSIEQALHSAICHVGDLVNKEVVDVNVVSPRTLFEGKDESQEVSDLLAGDFMGDFGGFLNRDIRESDFLLGYASTEAWLPDGLQDAGFDRGAIESMADEVRSRQPGDWRAANQGRARSRDLPRSARIDQARLLWDAMRALGADAVDFARVVDRARRLLRQATGAAPRGKPKR
jgi:predicted acylesterase/phospholipase RssA